MNIRADDDALTLSIDTAPEHGSVEINDAGTPSDTSDDFLIYTPEDNYFYCVSENAWRNSLKHNA